MTDIEPESFPCAAVLRLAGKGWLALRPPVGAVRFWVVQIGVLSLALFHEGELDEMAMHLPLGAVSTGLLLVPVVYAAFNFGRRGAVATALWATVLVLFGWLFIPHLSASHFWIESGYLMVINAVAVVVGQRVENEQRARCRAESALRAARMAEARYRSLFEEQPAPVIITDSGGVVTEINTAATRLFGRTVADRPLRQLLTVGVAEMLTEEPPCLSLRTLDGGEEKLFVPTAHVLATDDGGRLVQIVLTDVTEQRRRREEQQTFAGRLLAVQEDERRRLAQELHDDPLQNLMYLTRALDDLGDDPALPTRLTQQVLRFSAVATDVATTLRKVIRGLRPPILDDLGVVSAVRQLAEEARERSGLSIDLSVSGRQTRLSPELELTAYRTIQESLSNVVRHARARHVWIKVCFGERVRLTITDDGCGMQACATSRGNSGDGLGLMGMSERVNLAGGTLEVGPRRPHGTTVRAVLPCLPSPDESYVPSSIDSTVTPVGQ